MESAPDPPLACAMESEQGNELVYTFPIAGRDFGAAGSVSTRIKRILQHIGVRPDTIRRVAVATYEAEMNVVIHARCGEATLTASPSAVRIRISDEGPGIPDVSLAMQPGYSTASDEVREMGFGAGMGLPNIQRCADSLSIDTAVGIGTTLDMVFNNE